MARTQVHEAIVLKTVDVGEADRFCILFTKLAGRKAGRAKAVRKPHSKMGGSLLPCKRVRVEWVEHSSGLIITGAMDMGAPPRQTAHHQPFSRRIQGIEILLALTDDDEPLPQVYDLLLSFLDACVDEDSPLIPFEIRLLELLGLLPLDEDDARFAHLPPSAQEYVRVCAQGQGMFFPQPDGAYASAVERFLTSLLADHLQRPLRAEELR